jgi:hypothetical protein
MHTAGKVLLIIGGIITAIGVVMIVGGAASAGLNPESENVWEGTSGDFVIPDDDIYGIYASASVSCDQIIDPDGDGTGTISISITMKESIDDSSENGGEYFNKDCEYNSEDDYLDDDYQRVGSISWLWPSADAGDTVTINSDVKIYIVGDIEAFGDAVGGAFTALGGILVAVCGGVILLIGLILALTLKTKDPVIMQQGQMMGGQMMAGQMPMQQQMPAQQMPAQTTAQPYEYEQK